MDTITAIGSTGIHLMQETPLQEMAPLSPKNDFGVWLEKNLDVLNDQIRQAELQVRKVAAGEDVNLHEMMMSIEKAKLSFQLTLQIRNKILEAYQDIMRTQI